MTESDVDEYVDSDSSDNEEQYSKLQNAISQLDSTQKVKPASRKEVSSEVSEYNLTKGTGPFKNLVNVKELASVLGKKPGHASITKKFRKVTGKSKTLPKPLEKPVEERLKRSIGFENVKNQLRRWDAIVARNSLKSHISFPLNNNSMKMQNSKDFLNQFKSATPLEAEISKILQKDKEPEEDEEVNSFPLTYEEMMEKRKEMAQIRAKLSYKESKAQRQSKIKSKKYHRILKREKLKQQLKEFELLQKTDPEAALKKLTELDKSRALERASLRHRNTGQWAKNLTIRAKYDVESRKVLAEQLRMSREITQKVRMSESSDDEANGVVESSMNGGLDIPKDNPWGLNVSDEVTNFVSSYKKYWEEKNNEINQNQQNGEVVEEDTEKNSKVDQKEDTKPEKSDEEEIKAELNIQKQPEHSKNVPDKTAPVRSPKKIKKKKDTPTVSINKTSGVWIVTPVEDKPETTPEGTNKRKSDVIDDLFDDLNDRLQSNAKKKVKRLKSTLKRQERREKKRFKKKEENVEFDLSMKDVGGVERPDLDVELAEVGDRGGDVVENSVAENRLEMSNPAPPPEIDPKNFIQLKPKKLNTRLPENITGGDEALDDEEAQLKAIEEAFADDDVLAEFKEMKEKESNVNVEIQTSLPGWGEWAGSGIKPSARKKRQLVVNLPPRKDSKKEDLIINENENPNIKNHLVKEVPHPFKSVEAFEANIRAPVGRDWVPETAHRKLIKKNVETRLGAVINPMDDDEIVKMKQTPKSPYQGKKKKTKTNT